MGATLRQREADGYQPGSTVQLLNWISQVRSKKIKWLRSRRRNVRVEAVLSHALLQAEQELRIKQIARIDKWNQLKEQIAKKEQSTKDKNNNNMENNCNDMHKLDKLDNKTVWSSSLYPELQSLDNFMSQLSEIKVPVQR